MKKVNILKNKIPYNFALLTFYYFQIGKNKSK